ncbi:hypothetical protein MJT46_018983 [Ovis ammon polii x Ovis aries]|nr:hypothetical protein MJT46_018983 [Ovis ammon polii x Ovis aries]
MESVGRALALGQEDYKAKTGKKERSNTLNIAIENMCKKTRDLRRQLRKAIIDHVSDSFLDTTVPLLVLIEAAKNGREKEIKEYAAIFREHTSRLVEGFICFSCKVKVKQNDNQGHYQFLTL